MAESLAVRRHVAIAVATVSLVFAESAILAQEKSRPTLPQPDRIVSYKTVGDETLQLHLFLPEGWNASDQRPAALFFFGGGWVGGAPTQFYPHCQHLAEQGMVAMAAEYRTKKSHGTTPRECVEDGKSAVRYVRSHAGELGIDPARLAVGGGSAGGHVAAATATVTEINAASDDRNVSAVPDALILFNPVYDNSSDGYGYERVSGYWQQFSPMHNIKQGMPPSIVFLGTNDKLIPVATGKEFKKRSEAAGARSELVLYEGRPHGFFNAKNDEDYQDTLRRMDEFLKSLGYLPVKSAQPTP